MIRPGSRQRKEWLKGKKKPDTDMFVTDFTVRTEVARKTVASTRNLACSELA
jgi:hypothetical protein